MLASFLLAASLYPILWVVGLLLIVGVVLWLIPGMDATLKRTVIIICIVVAVVVLAIFLFNVMGDTPNTELRIDR